MLRTKRRLLERIQRQLASAEEHAEQIVQRAMEVVLGAGLAGDGEAAPGRHVQVAVDAVAAADRVGRLLGRGAVGAVGTVVIIVLDDFDRAVRARRKKYGMQQ